ncbi:pseudouridine synthase [Thalassotalea euphylliae]|uniref:RluA family pseudouridine synthase n=1 Tax=Thalassotalea euphylliae TaxID=1655234 RepID=UPI003628B102
MTNDSSTTHFTPLSIDSDTTLPAKFTYPFCYEPHPLSTLASEHLQTSLDKIHKPDDKIPGKMYGVLVVQNDKDQLGYLTAVSGDQSPLDHQYEIPFVPPVFEGFENDSEFNRKHQIVLSINEEIDALTTSSLYQQLGTLVSSEKSASEFQIGRCQRHHVENRKQRKKARSELSEQLANNTITEQEHREQSIELSRQSVHDKKTISALKDYWQQRIEQVSAKLNTLESQLDALKKQRRKLSSGLQKMLFKQYQMLNQHGDAKSVYDIFQETEHAKPPAGSGDCAAPKLLQYAFKNKLKPICMAEFWWGQAPKSEVRKHGQYYPACQGKCQPILGHMLQGITLDDNPLLTNPAENLELPIVYQDEHLVVVNKPAGLLSVPGKTIKDSVYTRIKTMFPDATGALTLHRLDMATSGLLVLALTPRSHKHLQKQFINKVIQKRYVALLENTIDTHDGEINLPLMLDIHDRPRQIVDIAHGKPAQTKWKVIEHSQGKTRLYLYPITGRTHQLRVHCSHPDGLNTPILGDELYGSSDRRLHLHAQRLSFFHPISQERVSFEVAPDF